MSAITANTCLMNGRGTRAWNRSLIEFTNTVRGVLHAYGSNSDSGCTATPKPGPLVRGSPSFWYFGAPIALSRFDRVIA